MSIAAERISTIYRRYDERVDAIDSLSWPEGERERLIAEARAERNADLAAEEQR